MANTLFALLVLSLLVFLVASKPVNTPKARQVIINWEDIESRSGKTTYDDSTTAADTTFTGGPISTTTEDGNSHRGHGGHGHQLLSTSAIPDTTGHGSLGSQGEYYGSNSGSGSRSGSGSGSGSGGGNDDDDDDDDDYDDEDDEEEQDMHLDLNDDNDMVVNISSIPGQRRPAGVNDSAPLVLLKYTAIEEVANNGTVVASAILSSAVFTPYKISKPIKGYGLNAKMNVTNRGDKRAIISTFYLYINEGGVSTFAGKNLSIGRATLKSFYRVNYWPFGRTSNKLRFTIVSQGLIPMQNLSVVIDEANATETLNMTFAGGTVIEKFLLLAEVDRRAGEPVRIEKINSTVTFQNNSAVREVILPWFNTTLTFDPSLQILLATKKSKDNTKYIIIGCVLGGVVLITVAIIVVLFIIWRRSPNHRMFTSSSIGSGADTL